MALGRPILELGPAAAAAGTEGCCGCGGGALAAGGGLVFDWRLMRSSSMAMSFSGRLLMARYIFSPS